MKKLFFLNNGFNLYPIMVTILAAGTGHSFNLDQVGYSEDDAEKRLQEEIRPQISEKKDGDMFHFRGEKFILPVTVIIKHGRLEGLEHPLDAFSSKVR